MCKTEKEKKKKTTKKKKSSKNKMQIKSTGETQLRRLTLYVYLQLGFIQQIHQQMH